MTPPQAHKGNGSPTQVPDPVLLEGCMSNYLWGFRAIWASEQVSSEEGGH